MDITSLQALMVPGTAERMPMPDGSADALRGSHDATLQAPGRDVADPPARPLFSTLADYAREERGMSGNQAILPMASRCLRTAKNPSSNTRTNFDFAIWRF